MLKRHFIPQEYHFYDLFEQALGHTVGAAKLLLKLTQDYPDPGGIAREPGALEHQCDEVAPEIMERLNKSFITPLDREDIHSVNLAKQILRGCEQLDSAVYAMRDMKKCEALSKDCITIHEVENAAADILHTALADLFETKKDAIMVIKGKDIDETMELATDRCEDAANVLQNVIVKMT
jgi:hypothetical protein